MIRNRKATDGLVVEWVEKMLLQPEKLLMLPLSSNKESMSGVGIDNEFVSERLSISYGESYKRKNLTLPLVEKMVELGIVVLDVTTRENITRQRILWWYKNLSLEDKKNLPIRNNKVFLKSLGRAQANWVNWAFQYELISKTIDEIHKDLYQLEIIGPNYKTLIERKRVIKGAKKAIMNWVNLICSDENVDTLWEIPISKHLKSPYGFNIAATYVQQSVGISNNSVYKYRELTYPLLEKMLEAGIILERDKQYDAVAVDLRRKLLLWYRKLSIKEKHELPIFGNKISLGRLPNNPMPCSSWAYSSPLVCEAWDEIHRELESFDIIKVDYQTVKERLKERKNRQEDIVESKIKRFERLGSNKLNVVNDFLEPSELEPFVQVEQLFSMRYIATASDSGRKNYIYGCSVFIDYLIDKYGNRPFTVSKDMDEHVLSRFRKYLEQRIIDETISSYHATGILSVLRTTLRRLSRVLDLGYTFFDVGGFEVSRSTDTNKPFSRDERLALLDAIQTELTYSQIALKPYKKIGVGKDPLGDDGKRAKGKSTLDNAQWLFENRLSCKPVHYSTASTRDEKVFLSIVQTSGVGLMEVYESWGIVPMITSNYIIPYVLKLAQVTGMNTDSILSLGLDDFVLCHQATSRPCLRYWKERSNGYKELHLDLFDAEITWLTSSQSVAIREIFNEVIQITSRFRQSIQDDKLRNLLFVCESDGRRNHGKAISILENRSGLGQVFSNFVEKYGLKNDQGEPLTMNISRFRPTFVSEMINNGVSLREIQLMLGHKSISVTINYLDSLDFNLNSRGLLDNKLSEIHELTLAEQVSEVSKDDTENEVEIIFQTPLAGCKNIFDPPDFVKSLSNYVPGSPCSQYNKCISCDNVIITCNHLPEIFAMQRDYLLLTTHSRVMDTPYGYVIKDNLRLINSIVDSEQSDFSTAELEQGLRLSEFIETTILADGVI
jgi:hypothetical protein